MNENIGVGLVVGLAIGITTYIWNSDCFTKFQKYVLLLFILFPPLQWISAIILFFYNYHQFKKSKEYKKEVTNHNEEKKIDNSKINLQELKNSGLITEEEFKEKVEKINSQKTILTILKSKEYSQLKALLDSNILTKEEFENKISILKGKVSNKDIIFSNKNYRIIDGYSEGLALAINDNLDYGFVNNNGEIVIDFIFEHAENFSNGIANVRIDGMIKKIDLRGNLS